MQKGCVGGVRFWARVLDAFSKFNPIAGEVGGGVRDEKLEGSLLVLRLGRQTADFLRTFLGVRPPPFTLSLWLLS